jgi:hypothetical protein
MTDEVSMVWIASDGVQWRLPPNADVIDAQHPDYEYWREAFELEELASDLSPPPALPQTPSGVEVPRVALTLSRELAAASLTMSVDHFDRHVLPKLRVVQVGRRKLIPVRELELWIEQNQARALK